ncbi:hypothetical protein DIPPA_34403 [Diplonema papillatum]|nr:hypothetical protein DIPPA_34403 [Diplonema papillatum]
MVFAPRTRPAGAPVIGGGGARYPAVGQRGRNVEPAPKAQAGSRSTSGCRASSPWRCPPSSDDEAAHLVRTRSTGKRQQTLASPPARAGRKRPSPGKKQAPKPTLKRGAPRGGSSSPGAEEDVHTQCWLCRTPCESLGWGEMPDELRTPCGACLSYYTLCRSCEGLLGEGRHSNEEVLFAHPAGQGHSTAFLRHLRQYRALLEAIAVEKAQLAAVALRKAGAGGGAQQPFYDLPTLRRLLGVVNSTLSTPGLSNKERGLLKLELSNLQEQVAINHRCKERAKKDKESREAKLPKQPPADLSPTSDWRKEVGQPLLEQAVLSQAAAAYTAVPLRVPRLAVPLANPALDPAWSPTILHPHIPFSAEPPAISPAQLHALDHRPPTEPASHHAPGRSVVYPQSSTGVPPSAGTVGPNPILTALPELPTTVAALTAATRPGHAAHPPQEGQAGEFLSKLSPRRNPGEHGETESALQRLHARAVPVPPSVYPLGSHHHGPVVQPPPQGPPSHGGDEPLSSNNRVLSQSLGTPGNPCPSFATGWREVDVISQPSSPRKHDERSVLPEERSTCNEPGSGHGMPLPRRAGTASVMSQGTDNNDDLSSYHPGAHTRSVSGLSLHQESPRGYSFATARGSPEHNQQPAFVRAPPAGVVAYSPRAEDEAPPEPQAGGGFNDPDFVRHRTTATGGLSPLRRQGEACPVYAIIGRSGDVSYTAPQAPPASFLVDAATPPPKPQPKKPSDPRRRTARGQSAAARRERSKSALDGPADAAAVQGEVRRLREAGRDAAEKMQRLARDHERVKAQLLRLRGADAENEALREQVRQLQGLADQQAGLLMAAQAAGRPLEAPPRPDELMAAAPLGAPSRSHSPVRQPPPDRRQQQQQQQHQHQQQQPPPPPAPHPEVAELRAANANLGRRLLLLEDELARFKTASAAATPFAQQPPAAAAQPLSPGGPGFVSARAPSPLRRLASDELSRSRDMSPSLDVTTESRFEAPTPIKIATPLHRQEVPRVVWADPSGKMVSFEVDPDTERESF